jgi:signal transduction histidine kinase
VLVHCSEKVIARALRNLVQNAIYHTADGTTVEVRVHYNGAIQVSDHGPGVPLDQRELIFRRFWRGERRDRPGAGLGLSIVKRAAETCGGTIELSDTPGGGATFTLSLPLVEDSVIAKN